MNLIKKHIMVLGGALAGILSGIFGAGGGMVLVPLLEKENSLQENQLFSSSITIMLPVTAVSLLTGGSPGVLTFTNLPYCLLGGLLGGYLTDKIKLKPGVLHRLFGIMILWGGIRYLWHSPLS